MTLLEVWKQAEREPFSGWDFSFLEGKRFIEPTPWSYEAMVRELMPEAEAVLDLGTGGGEKLLEFKDVFPEKVIATEDYAPNLELARKRLKPLGVEVVAVEPSSLFQTLPFKSNEFDLIIDRHTAFNIGEIARVLKPGGVFLTQQVDDNGARDFYAAFDTKPKWEFFTLEFILEKVEATNLVVLLAQEWQGKVHYNSVAALVYFRTFALILWEAALSAEIARRSLLLQVHRAKVLTC